MSKILILIFGSPDVGKIALMARGFVFALAASSIGALLYLITQWSGGEAIDWITAKQIFAYNVAPTLTLWFTALQSWLKSQSAISLEELNKMLEIGIQLPSGATPEDVKAIYERTLHERRDDK